MWFGLLGVAMASGVEPHMWEHCVELDLLSEEDHRAVRKVMVSHPPGAPQLRTAIDGFIEANPRCPALWMARAGVSHAEGRADEALVDLKQAAAVGEDWPAVQRALAVAMHQAGGAGEVLERAIELSPDDALLKLYHADEHPPSERSRLLLEAVNAHPDNIEVAIAAVDSLAKTEPLRAVALARERYAHLPDPELKKRIHRLQGHFDAEAPDRIRRPAEFRTLEDGTEEVVVYSPASARAAITERLASMGYGEGVQIDGGIRYRSEKALEPWVKVYDDGRVEVQSAGWAETEDPMADDGTITIPSISKKKLAKRRAKVLENIWYEVTVWRQARIRVAVQEMLGVRLPDQLAALWERGEPMFGEGEVEEVSARRAALLDYWASRPCTEDGKMTREVVETYMRRVVQESEAPFTSDEIAAASSRSTCPDAPLEIGE